MLVAAEATEAFSPSWFAEEAGDADGITGGRGSVRVFDTSIGPLIRRDYLRGGLPRFLSRDRYIWTGANRTRSFAEFRLLIELRRRGLPVPAPVVARYRRHGFVYHAALLMHFIPDARPLADVLSETDEPERYLALAADAVARLHSEAVWHADLNAMNILIDDASCVWLIDFDRARMNVTDVTLLERNLDRLLRSLRKLLEPDVLKPVESAWPDFRRRYRAGLAGVFSAT